MTTEPTTLVQARVSKQYAQQVDQDMDLLGITNRSEAVREGLQLLHRQAQQKAMAREYDEFYSRQEAPLTEMTAVGDQLATQVITSDQTDAAD